MARSRQPWLDALDMAAISEVHVLPRARDATWIVGLDLTSPALSSHKSADEAQLAAGLVAEARGARCIVLHDRYQRVRTIAPSRSRH
jgi:hypothetical protein